jgi:predicted ATPase/DNA-binding CsgD family transcriptional regulator
VIPVVSSSAFVGRENELAHIRAAFADPACRLLTLVGPGGIGKTRLALEAARQFAAPEQVHFIPLQPLTSPDFIVSAIAEALGFQFFGSATPRQQLLDYLRTKDWLLVVDNFEQLLDDAALLSEILAYAPGIRLLVTSRERLNLVEEWVLEVGGMMYPEDDGDTQAYSSVELFTQQARRAKVGFALTDEDRRAAARICRMVGGMPLAIELAANWVRALSCAAIADEIARSLDILETPARNVEPRHRTMRAAFEPTWARLSGHERDVLMCLSVFRGGFTREAAETVVGASLRTLSALVDKSLVRVDANGRYDLHELLRQYAADKLIAAEQVDAAARRHCDYFLALAENAEAHAFGAEQTPLFNTLETEFGNLRAALAWSVNHETGLRLSSSLCWFFSERSHWNEGLRWLERALVVNPNAPASLRAKAMHSAAALAGLLRRKAQLHALCEESLVLGRTANDRWNIAWALSHWGHYDRSDPAQGIAMLEESIALFRELGDSLGLSHTLVRRAFYAMDGDDAPLARRLFEEAETCARAAGDRIILAWTALGLGWVPEADVRDVEHTRTQFERSIALFHEARFPAGHNTALIALGELEEELGNTMRAQMLYDQALLSFRDRPSCAEQLPFVIGQMACIAWSNQEFQRAAQLLGAACKGRLSEAATDEPSDDMAIDLRRQLGESAYAQAWQAGSSLTIEEIIAYALERVSSAANSSAVVKPQTTPFQSHLLSNPLTRRELDILCLLAEGQTNQEIANHFVLAPTTVKWYIHQILDKLDVTNRTRAVHRARELGLIP